MGHLASGPVVWRSFKDLCYPNLWNFAKFRWQLYREPCAGHVLLSFMQPHSCAGVVGVQVRWWAGRGLTRARVPTLDLHYIHEVTQLRLDKVGKLPPPSSSKFPCWFWHPANFVTFLSTRISGAALLFSLVSLKTTGGPALFDNHHCICIFC